MSPAEKEIDQSTYSNRLAVNIRTRRKELGYSAEDMLERIVKFNKSDRKPPQTIYSYHQWENGKGAPHYDLLPALANALNLKDVHALMPKK